MRTLPSPLPPSPFIQSSVCSVLHALPRTQSDTTADEHKKIARALTHTRREEKREGREITMKKKQTDASNSNGQSSEQSFATRKIYARFK